jgi:peptidoglycan hydrolase-like protein with peptidoglycan-binding domain
MALTWPVEQQGSKGENVRSIQYLLNARMPATSGTTKSEGAAASADQTSPAAGEASATTAVNEAPPSATVTEAPPSATVTEAPPSAMPTAAAEPLDVDGIFGPKTDAAVRAFQAEHGLTADGKVGNQTWPVLIIEVSAGSTGDAVRAVQSQLRSRCGWLKIDGVFGPQTDGVVRHFQGFCELSKDGIAGVNTWNALTLQWLRASNAQSAAELVFQAWSKGDRTAARYEAIPPAVEMLFARTYEAGWTFGACQVTGATFACTWQRTGDKLILEGNNSTSEPVYAPFYFFNNVASEI